jgi:hypothetical protein
MQIMEDLNELTLDLEGVRACNLIVRDALGRTTQWNNRLRLSPFYIR